MNKLMVLLLLVVGLDAIAQDPNDLARPIVEEGKRLYRLEMASWYGTDIFLEKHPDTTKVKAYFSYIENNLTKCIFYSKADTPKVLGSITFDSTYNTQTAITDFTERNLTSAEHQLYEIRNKAADIITSDTLFKTYPKASLNLVPIINGSEKKVYILTGPKENGIVIFGNDYLLIFDKDNNLVSKRKLHNNIISITYSKEKAAKATMHTHLPETGEFITATDICTLMLYARLAKWNQHNVISKNYLNIWNCKTNQLAVVPLSALKKINAGEKRERKKRDEK